MPATNKIECATIYARHKRNYVCQPQTKLNAQLCSYVYLVIFISHICIATTYRYVEFHGFKTLFAEYQQEVARTNLKSLQKTYFYAKWSEVMKNGVTDPDTGIAYKTHVRVNHCRGFSTCDDCSLLQAQIGLAKLKDEQEKYTRLLKQHLTEVSDDREELARIARKCKIYPEHVGYMIDAIDKHKLCLPTTEASAKCLAKMPRIVQKLTGVQSFKDDSLLLFRTLPDVPTGGNLTLTIVLHLFTLPEVQQATDLYLNLDGASDNVCYHLLYGLAYFLRRSSKAGWRLRRIHFLRFKVYMYYSLTH